MSRHASFVNMFMRVGALVLLLFSEIKFFPNKTSDKCIRSRYGEKSIESVQNLKNWSRTQSYLFSEI